MYEELVKRLRYDAELLSQDGWAAGLFTEAADAIEERDRYALTIQHEMMAEAESHIALVERLNKQIEELELHYCPHAIRNVHDRGDDSICRVLGTEPPKERKTMVGKYKVITLCGSTRFKDAFIESQKRLTLEGNIVISVGLFGHSGDKEVWTEGTKEMLDDMHKRKIDMADEILVINVGGYIGSSTRSEIQYAKATGKEVRYLEPPKEEV